MTNDTSFSVDRSARHKAAELLRHFASGQISNDEFEDAFPYRSPDEAIIAVRQAAWYLYDDLHEHRLVGKYALNKLGKHELGRWIVFLYTDLPYEWPIYGRIHRLVGFFLALITFGLYSGYEHRKFASYGEVGVWPFIRRAEYEAAIARPNVFGESVG